jgi:putative PIN family toxin of toxin-antitoxin system
MRLVLDTDVLLSSLRSTVGASRVLLLAVEAGMVTPLVSVATVIEYEAVLKRAEHLQAAGLDAEEVDRFLNDFVAHADQITPYFQTRPSVRDPDDEMFAELAINGQADALVSFNIGDYRPADPRVPRLGIPVCRPGDILRRLPWRPSATSRSAFLPP